MEWGDSVELPSKTELEETDLQQQARTLYSAVVPLKSGVHHGPLSPVH